MKRQRPRMTYEFRKVSFSKAVPRSVSLQELNDEAEYGKWELARTRISVGGVRTVWLRRKIMPLTLST
jgi:predicted RNA-binding protein with PUA-like domain